MVPTTSALDFVKETTAETLFNGEDTNLNYPPSTDEGSAFAFEPTMAALNAAYAYENGIIANALPLIARFLHTTPDNIVIYSWHHTKLGPASIVGANHFGFVVQIIQTIPKHSGPYATATKHVFLVRDIRSIKSLQYKNTIQVAPLH